MIGVPDPRWQFRRFGDCLYFSIASDQYGIFTSYTMSLSDAERFFARGVRRCQEMRQSASDELQSAIELSGVTC